MDPKEIGKQIKQKYSQYKDFSDEEIGVRTLQKYPQYGNLPSADLGSTTSGQSAQINQGGKFTIPEGVTPENVGQLAGGVIGGMFGNPLVGRVAGGSFGRALPKAVQYRAEKVREEGLSGLLGGLPSEQKREVYGELGVGGASQILGEGIGKIAGIPLKYVAGKAKSLLNLIISSKGLTETALGIKGTALAIDKAVADKFGTPTITDEAMSRKLSGSAEKILTRGKAELKSSQKILDQVLPQIEKTFNLKEIITGLKTELVGLAKGIGSKSKVKPMNDAFNMILKNNKAELTAKEASTLIKNLSSKAIYFGGKVASDISAGEQYAQRMVADTLRNKLRLELTKEAADALGTQSFWLKLRPLLYKKQAIQETSQTIPQSLLGMFNVVQRPFVSTQGALLTRDLGQLFGKGVGAGAKAVGTVAKQTAGQSALSDLINRTSQYQGVPQGQNRGY